MMTPFSAAPLDAGSADVLQSVVLDHMREGVAHCRMVYGAGRPDDFHFLYTNPAFHRHTGLGEVVGKRVSEVIPGITLADPQLFEIYARVAKGGAPEAFERYVTSMAQWYAVQVFSPRRDEFVLIFNEITGARQAEQRRSQERAEQTAILDSGIVGLVKVRNRRIVWANQAFADQFGYTLVELVGQSTELLYPTKAAYESFYRAALPVLHAGEAYCTESQQRCKDGSLRWFAVRRTLLAPGGDEIIGAFFDITERMRAEAALLRSQALLAEAQQIARIGNWLVDLGSGAVTWSDVMFQNYAVTQRLPGPTADNCLDTVHPDDAHLSPQAFARAIETEQPFELVHRVIAADGSIRHVQVRGQPFYADDGRPVRVAGTAQDITAAVLLQAELAQSQALLHGSFSAMSEGLVIHRQDGHIVDANPAAETILGLSRDQLMGKTSMDPHWCAIHEDGSDFPGDTHPAMVALAGGAPVLQRIMGVRAPAFGMRWLSINAVPIFEPGDPQAHAVVTTFVDITEQRRTQQIRLETDRLEAENASIRESNRVKNLFVANMSHELRTPLNAVIGLAHVLEAGIVKPDSAKFKPYLQQIGSSGKHLLGLIDAVLDLAMIEAGKFVFKPVPIDLAVLLGEVVNMQADVATTKQIVLDTRIDPDLGPIELDPLRLKQVLGNYLSNALKFTPDGGQVALRLLADGAQMLRIEVQDNGIGIAAADLPRLFSEFQQLSVGRAKAYPGTGLGLALTRRLVEAQGGSIGVRSTLGAGSVFHALLPRHHRQIEPVGVDTSWSGEPRGA